MIKTTPYCSVEKTVTLKLRSKVRERERGWFERRRMSCFEHFLEYLGEILLIDPGIIFRGSQAAIRKETEFKIEIEYKM